MKFEVVQPLEDGSFLSWIAPDRQSKSKGAQRIPIRVIEYTIEVKGVEQTYSLITDLRDITTFPALLTNPENSLMAPSQVKPRSKQALL